MAPETSPQATVAAKAPLAAGEAAKAGEKNAAKASPREQGRTSEKRLQELEKLRYRPVDYSQLLVPREYTPQKPPSFDDMIDSAKRKVEVKYFVHHLVDGGAVALFVALAVATMDSLLAPVFLMGAVAGVAIFISDSQARRKAMNAVMKSTAAYAEQQLEAFWKAEEEAKAEFDINERNRIWEVRRLAEGNGDAVTAEIGKIVRAFSLPFPVAVTIELYANQPQLFLKFPTDEFIPRVKSGRDDKYPRSGAEIKRIYSNIVVSVTTNLALEMLARIRGFDYICANAYILNEEERAYIFGVRIRRSQAEQVPTYSSAAEYLKTVTTAHQLAADGSMNFQEPLQAEWHGTILSREIQKIQIACKLESAPQAEKD
jgi:hypothetical protein